MPRFAQVTDGVVTGVVAAAKPPTVGLVKGRNIIFVDVTELPSVVGGETYEGKTGVFSPPPSMLAPLLIEIRDGVQEQVKLLQQIAGGKPL